MFNKVYGLQDVAGLPMAQQATANNSAAASLQCTEEFDDMDASADSQAQRSLGGSPTGCGLASRPPSQQEIQHMDELDLSINLGSLLGPDDSWIADDDDQLRSLEALPGSDATGGSLSTSKPFQELFP